MDWFLDHVFEEEIVQRDVEPTDDTDRGDHDERSSKDKEGS